ncbi:hypothetical protein GCM10027290_50880 [Micromonospora sonneratiae]
MVDTSVLPVPPGQPGRPSRRRRHVSSRNKPRGRKKAGRPYDLGVSLWLNGGLPAPDVAEWAGHSVDVLLKVYAKCLDGDPGRMNERIEVALSQ